MNPMTLTDADHGGLIFVEADDAALLAALRLDMARAEANELNRQWRAKQVPAVERRVWRGIER